MKEGTLILILLTIIVIAITTIVVPSLIILDKSITGKAIDSQTQEKNINIFTKTLCNQSNYCQDYKITCWNDQVIEIRSISNSSDHFSEDLENSEIKEMIKRLCD